MFQPINAQLDLEQCCIIRINPSLTLNKCIAAVMHATVHAVHPYPLKSEQSESGNCILSECITSVCLHVAPSPSYKACVIVSFTIPLDLVTSWS